MFDRSQATKVWENLWVGSLQDAKLFNGERLCVLEGGAPQGTTFHIPILTIPAPVNAPTPLWASRAQLDKCVWLIDARLAAGKKLLVHCGAGIERSPLTCAYWLVKKGHCPTLDTAYIHLRAIRPIVADRTAWLEPSSDV